MHKIVGLLIAGGTLLAIPAMAQPAPGTYHCVFSINGQLQTVPGFTIKAGGKYRHEQDQTDGSFTYAAADKEIDFTGGALDKQGGVVQNHDGLGVISLYNEKRSRTVIDCDTKM